MRRLLPALLTLLAGCADAGTNSGSLRYYLTADPVTLDPALSTDVQSGEVVALIYDNLVQFDVDGRLVPGLARSWESDSTGRVYTFHLRTGVTFHDGRPVTARDVEASILRALAPGSRGRQWPLEPIEGARAYAAGTAEGIAGMRVPDDTTIVFTLSEPLNIFPKFLAMPVAGIVPTPTPADFAERPVGSGPYALDFIDERGFAIIDGLLHGYGIGILPPSLPTEGYPRTPTRPVRMPGTTHQPFTFTEDMTVVLQPNVTTKDGTAGVQMGNLVRVTGTGVECMHQGPLELLRA